MIYRKSNYLSMKFSINYLKCSPVVCIAATSRIDGLASGLPGTADVIDFSDIIHYFDHDKSSSISKLTKGKSRDLEKQPKYFNGMTTSASNILLLFGALPIIFVLSSKELIVIYLKIMVINFNSRVI